MPLGQPLELSFDDLNADQKEYYYKIEHMTFDWKPSDISQNEYITGFNQNPITSVENSFNTLQNYSHYSVQIPNSNIRITKSGNYLLSVLDTYDNVVFTRRITYYENKAVVGVNVLNTRNQSNDSKNQRVQFRVNFNNREVKNPSQEIEVVILQNDIWENAITNIKPQFYRQNQLVYNYPTKTNFSGGNEYLNFDNKQIRSTSIRIAEVAQKNIFHHYLYTQEKRNNLVYTYNPDINGQYVIRTTESNNPNLEADYVMVHFSLASEKIDKEIYVFGAFNNFDTNNENKMKYNSSTNKYEASILLKQGFYNYTFATKNDKLNLIELNGNHQETENNYSVIVYYKPFGQNYYRAIGLGTITSKL